MEVVSDPFFHILTYIQEISGLAKRRMGTWFISTVVDWMETDLNASLSIIRMGEGLCNQNNWRIPACITREKMIKMLLDAKF